MHVEQAVVRLDSREELDAVAVLAHRRRDRRPAARRVSTSAVIGKRTACLDDGHVDAVAVVVLVVQRRLAEDRADRRREDQRIGHRRRQRHDQRDRQVFHEVADDARPEQQRREGGDAGQRRGDDRAGHALGGQLEGLRLVHAFRHAPLGEFGDDDGVVDQHADRQDQREQHDHVDRVAHQRQQPGCPSGTMTGWRGRSAARRGPTARRG